MKFRLTVFKHCRAGCPPRTTDFAQDEIARVAPAAPVPPGHIQRSLFLIEPIERPFHVSGNTVPFEFVEGSQNQRGRNGIEERDQNQEGHPDRNQNLIFQGHEKHLSPPLPERKGPEWIGEQPNRHEKVFGKTAAGAAGFRKPPA
jgi:hypothetical protein